MCWCWTPKDVTFQQRLVIRMMKILWHRQHCCCQCCLCPTIFVVHTISFFASSSAGWRRLWEGKMSEVRFRTRFLPVAVLPVEYKACNVHVCWCMCSLLLDKSNAANLDAKNVWSNTVTLGYTEYGNAGQYGPMLLIFITATLSTQMTLNIITRSFSATMLILLVAPCWQYCNSEHSHHHTLLSNAASFAHCLHGSATCITQHSRSNLLCDAAHLVSCYTALPALATPCLAT